MCLTTAVQLIIYTPCGHLSVYARNISQYSNTIFYFIGTSYTNDDVWLESVHNITLQGIGYPFPIITCAGESYEIFLLRSNNISISNLTFDCNMNIENSNNVTIHNSIILKDGFHTYDSFDTKIISSIFNNGSIRIDSWGPEETILSGTKQYSVTLTNISVQYELYIEILNQLHNLLKIDQVKARGGIIITTDTTSLYSIHITNTSCYNAEKGLLIEYRQPLHYLISLHYLSHIIIEDSHFYNNTAYGIQVQGYVDSNTVLSALRPGNILIKSCSISYNINYGISIEDNSQELLATIRIADTEITGNRRNALFLSCHPVLEKYFSTYKVFEFWSQFKPIIDSYSGPMKDQYRFWPGLLLATRIPVILIATLLRNKLRILLLCMALTVSVIILSLSVILGGVYRKRLHSIIEFWFLFNLCVITALSLVFTDNDAAILLNICIGIFTSVLFL